MNDEDLAADPQDELDEELAETSAPEADLDEDVTETETPRDDFEAIDSPDDVQASEDDFDDDAELDVDEPDGELVYPEDAEADGGDLPYEPAAAAPLTDSSDSTDAESLADIRGALAELVVSVASVHQLVQGIEEIRERLDRMEDQLAALPGTPDGEPEPEPSIEDLLTGNVAPPAVREAAEPAAAEEPSLADLIGQPAFVRTPVAEPEPYYPPAPEPLWELPPEPTYESVVSSEPVLSPAAFEPPPVAPIEDPGPEPMTAEEVTVEAPPEPMAPLEPVPIRPLEPVEPAPEPAPVPAAAVEPVPPPQVADADDSDVRFGLGATVSLRVSPVAGFQELTRVQGALSQTSFVRRATVEAYSRGEARLIVELADATTAASLASGLGSNLNRQARVHEASEEQQMLKVVLG